MPFRTAIHASTLCVADSTCQQLLSWVAVELAVVFELLLLKHETQDELVQLQYHLSSADVAIHEQGLRQLSLQCRL